MKKLRCSSSVSLNKKIACTVSAAALMLGVSSAATIGLHFQENYCNSAGAPDPGYSGFPVTMTAFGIESNGWENLTPMDTGYQGCKGPLGYTLSESIDSTTSTNGLNPLPNGALTVNWFGPTANYSGFAGYAANPPHYNFGGSFPYTAPPFTGEAQIYATFLRDGVNFGPTSTSGQNNQPGYSVDITGLKSLFTNSPFVVELMASGDSIESLTNAFVIDVPGSITNSVTYPNTPPVNNTEGVAWVSGSGGGLSTGSAALNTDHIHIMSAPPQQLAGEYNHAGTISGFIITDKPVISMSPVQVITVMGDTITLNPYAIGVPPLSYQWRRNGVPIPGATTSSNTIAAINPGNAGIYDLVVTNLYGSATSRVVNVGDAIAETPAANLVYDSNPSNTQHDGVDMGATWAASNSDGTITRTGVMSFVAADTNGISVADSPDFDATTGTVTFWMRAVVNNSANNGASIFCRATGTAGSDFVIYQGDGSPGNLNVQGPTGSGIAFVSSGAVGDDKWHFVALTFDQSATGGANLYIDGALDSTNGNGASWTWTLGQPLEIGYSSDATWTAYNGVLDDVRYYNAELSSSLINTLFHNVVDDNDLVMQLNFTAPPGNGFVLNWLEGSAILQSAPALTGPWIDLPGAASPYTIVPATTQQFFRYKYAHAPQSVVSNPYLM
jgi:hypothetical protein